MFQRQPVRKALSQRGPWILGFSDERLGCLRHQLRRFLFCWRDRINLPGFSWFRVWGCGVQVRSKAMRPGKYAGFSCARMRCREPLTLQPLSHAKESLRLAHIEFKGSPAVPTHLLHG